MLWLSYPQIPALSRCSFYLTLRSQHWPDALFILPSDHSTGQRHTSHSCGICRLHCHSKGCRKILQGHSHTLPRLPQFHSRKTQSQEKFLGTPGYHAGRRTVQKTRRLPEISCCTLTIPVILQGWIYIMGLPQLYTFIDKNPQIVWRNCCFKVLNLHILMIS